MKTILQIAEEEGAHIDTIPNESIGQYYAEFSKESFERFVSRIRAERKENVKAKVLEEFKQFMHNKQLDWEWCFDVVLDDYIAASKRGETDIDQWTRRT
jgi:uncharacterized protein YdiU (UPF0061 family)